MSTKAAGSWPITRRIDQHWLVRTRYRLDRGVETASVEIAPRRCTCEPGGEPPLFEHCQCPFPDLAEAPAPRRRKPKAVTPEVDADGNCIACGLPNDSTGELEVSCGCDALASMREHEAAARPPAGNRVNWNDVPLGGFRTRDLREVPLEELSSQFMAQRLIPLEDPTPVADGEIRVPTGFMSTDPEHGRDWLINAAATAPEPRGRPPKQWEKFELAFIANLERERLKPTGSASAPSMGAVYRDTWDEYNEKSKRPTSHTALESLARNVLQAARNAPTPLVSKGKSGVKQKVLFTRAGVKACQQLGIQPLELEGRSGEDQ